MQNCKILRNIWHSQVKKYIYHLHYILVNLLSKKERKGDALTVLKEKIMSLYLEPLIHNFFSLGLLWETRDTREDK